MSDNVLQTLQKLVQDVIAPDVRELKVRVESLEKQMDARFDSVDQRFQSVDKRFESLEKQIDANTKAILAAISESRAQSELATMSAIASLRERIAVLESRHN